MSTVDDVTALALAAGQGDRAALSEFIRATQTEVWQFVARLSGSEAADDLTQETYLRVLNALASFRAQSSARTWLLTIRPCTVLADWRKVEQRNMVCPDPAESLHLEDLLGTLSMDRREALVLTQLLGFSYAEAAEICGCAVGTIRSRVARARTDLVMVLARREETALTDSQPAGPPGDRGVERFDDDRRTTSAPVRRRRGSP